MFRPGWEEEEGQKESNEGGMSEGGRNVLVYNMNIETSMYVNGKCGMWQHQQQERKGKTYKCMNTS